MDSAEQEVAEQREKSDTLQPPAQDGDEIKDEKSSRETENVEGEELSLPDGQSGALEEEKPSEVETADPADPCKEKSQTGVVHPLVS